MLLLTYSLIGSVAVNRVFSSLAQLTANYRQELEFNHETYEDNEKQRLAQQQPSPNASVEIIEGPNGTKIMYIKCTMTVTVQQTMGGEIFDYNAYIRQLIMWKTLQNTFETLRDIGAAMAETIICIFVFLGITHKRKKMFL